MDRITHKYSKQGDDYIMSYLSQGIMEHTHNRPKKPCKIWIYFAGFFWPVVINER